MNRFIHSLTLSINNRFILSFQLQTSADDFLSKLPSRPMDVEMSKASVS